MAKHRFGCHHSHLQQLINQANQNSGFCQNPSFLSKLEDIQSKAIHLYHSNITICQQVTNTSLQSLNMTDFPTSAYLSSPPLPLFIPCCVHEIALHYITQLTFFFIIQSDLQVPCSRALQRWMVWDSNLQPSHSKTDSLTIRPLDSLTIQATPAPCCFCLVSCRTRCSSRIINWQKFYDHYSNTLTLAGPTCYTSWPFTKSADILDPANHLATEQVGSGR